MDIETALRQQFIVFPCQADAFTRQKERGNGTRVFTFESPKFRPGSRKFLSTSVAKFWQWYEQCRVHRHFYELIQEGTPCRPYFDLEYYREFNHHLDAHETLSAFLRLCREVFAEELGVKLTNRSFLLLDSSTETKFSVHVTIHLPDGKLFPNNVILKALVDRICARMSETGVGIVRTEDKDTFLCDTGVYSKNRNFRLYLSSKCGKDAVLRFADYCDFYDGKKAPDWRIFLDSLVVPNDYEKFELLDLSALVGTLPRNALRCAMNTSNSVQRLPLEAFSLRRNDYVDEIAKGTGSSPFSAIDMNILTFLRRFSPNVGIRQWQLQIAKTTNSRRLQYELVNCRYCFNVERQHKNQNVYWVVDLERFCYFQKCFDVECRNFISNRFQLPDNVVKAMKPRVVPIFTLYKRNSMDDSVEERRLIGWLQNESRRRSSLGSPQGLRLLPEDSFNSSRRDRSLAAHLERRSSLHRSRLSAGQEKDSFYNDIDLEYLVDKVAERQDPDSFYDLRSDEKFKQFRRSSLAKKILIGEDSFDNPENDFALAAALEDDLTSRTSNSATPAMATPRACAAPEMTTPCTLASRAAPTKFDSKQAAKRRRRSKRKCTQEISIVEETPPSTPTKQSNARSQSPQILDESLQIETPPQVLSIVKKAAAAPPQRGNKRRSALKLPKATAEYTRGNDLLLAAKDLDQSQNPKASSLFVATNLNLALAYLKLMQYGRCVMFCDKVLHHESNNVKALCRKGEALQASGHRQNAVALFEQVIKLEPKNKAARQYLLRLRYLPDVIFESLPDVVLKHICGLLQPKDILNMRRISRQLKCSVDANSMQFLAGTSRSSEVSIRRSPKGKWSFERQVHATATLILDAAAAMHDGIRSSLVSLKAIRPVCLRFEGDLSAWGYTNDIVDDEILTSLHPYVLAIRPHKALRPRLRCCANFPDVYTVVEQLGDLGHARLEIFMFNARYYFGGTPTSHSIFVSVEGATNDPRNIGSVM